MDRAEAMDRLRLRGVPSPSIITEPGDPGAPPRFLIRSGHTIVSEGRTLREAMRNGKFLAERHFTAHGSSVMLDGENVATAKSNNLALRITNALNAYKPGPRGH